MMKDINIHKIIRIVKDFKKLVCWKVFQCAPVNHIPEGNMEPLVGIEPTTYSLRMNCSTPELQRRLRLGRREITKSSGKRQAANLLPTYLPLRNGVIHRH